MPGSVTSVFSEPADFEIALHAEGVLSLLITSPGEFRARLTQIALHRLRLSAVEEELPQIAFAAGPQGMVLVWLTFAGHAPIWGGVEMRAGEIITIGPGERLHARTVGPCRWGAIQVTERDLLQYARILNGGRFVVPPGIARWRPAGRDLHNLHRASIRSAEARSRGLADIQAAHGLEQQLIHALVECLLPGSADEETPAARRHRNVVAGFEELLQAGSSHHISEICAALGVSDRLLRECCKAHLGMSPSGYRHRLRMGQVRRELGGGNPQTTTVSEVAGRHGFRDLGRFAGHYRAIYGELPSATVRRGLDRGVADLGLGRRRMKLP